MTRSRDSLIPCDAGQPGSEKRDDKACICRQEGEANLRAATERDRVGQTAAELVLEPIFELDFDPNAYGYRPQRSAQDAVQKVHEMLRNGQTDDRRSGHAAPD